MTDRFVTELMGHFNQTQAPFTAHKFGSLFMVKYSPDFAYGDLLFYLLRLKGVHIWDGRPCFLTTAHTEVDLALVMTAFRETITELQGAGFLQILSEPTSEPVLTNNKLPYPNAKLGRDPQGNPAWYIPDPARAGKYLQVMDAAANGAAH